MLRGNIKAGAVRTIHRISIFKGFFMKLILRRLLYVGIALSLFIAAGLSYFILKYPDVDAPGTLNVERTPERIARGKYLATHVAGCIDCHSSRDWKYFAAPLIPGTEGKGGEVFDENFGLPGRLYAKNITPAGIGSLTDGELFRILTSGVDKNGKVLFPLMPYPRFNALSDEDIYSIIAYIRTLPPVDNAVPPSHINFPVNLLIRTTPTRHQPQPEPNTADPYEYGKYLVNAAACADCHTPQSNGIPIKGMDFAGGMEFKTPMGMIRSANITPDEETGIGNWTKEFFIARFKTYASERAKYINPDSMKYYTIMPWTLFAGMNEEELGAIYTHLHTLAPVKHKIVRYEPISERSE
jgi:mono/diheme cytochrome c family protein